MPSYLSHAILGDDVYNCSKNNNLFKINIEPNEIRAYSLGIDLSMTSLTLKKDPHNNKTKDFFLYIIKYIKNNKLYYDKHVMALLYGHICHYYFDINAHPYIFYLSKKYKNTTIIPNHYMIEGYLSSYLSNKILNKNIFSIDNNYFSNVNLSNHNVINLLNNTYKKVYSCVDSFVAYKNTLHLFCKLDDLYKKTYLSNEDIINLSGFNLFLKNNNIKRENLNNENHNKFLNFNNIACYDSFLEMYIKSLYDTLNAIEEINKYFYYSAPFSIIENIFDDISYDSALACSKSKLLDLKIR